MKILSFLLLLSSLAFAGNSTTPTSIWDKTGTNAIGVTSNALNAFIENFPASQPISIAGLSKVNLARNVYSSVNVTTSAYVQLIASTADVVNQINIFDSSGQTLVLAVGGSGSEVDQIYITPGGNGTMNLGIPSGSRVSVKAVSATANVGELDISLLK